MVLTISACHIRTCFLSLPEMVVHYIEQHHYCPPGEFISAVLRSPLPNTEEYQIITEPFWHLHRERVRMVKDALAANPGN